MSARVKRVVNRRNSSPPTFATWLSVHRRGCQLGCHIQIRSRATARGSVKAQSVISRLRGRRKDGVSAGGKIPHRSGRVVWSRRSKTPSVCEPSAKMSRGRRDERRGTVRTGAAGGLRGGAEPARSGTAVRDRPTDGGQDAGVRGAAGIPAKPSSAAAEARAVRRDDRWTYPDSVDGIGLGLASWFNLAESVLPRLA